MRERHSTIFCNTCCCNLSHFRTTSSNLNLQIKRMIRTDSAGPQIYGVLPSHQMFFYYYLSLKGFSRRCSKHLPSAPDKSLVPNTECVIEYLIPIGGNVAFEYEHKFNYYFTKQVSKTNSLLLLFFLKTNRINYFPLYLHLN